MPLAIGDRRAPASAIQERCFLVGCIRSGTTLLQSLLAAHPQVTSFPESMFYRIAVGQAAERARGVLPRTVKQRVGRLVRETRWRLGVASPVGRRRAQSFLREMEREDCMDLFPKSA